MDTAEWFLFQVRRQLQESGVDSRSRILCAVSGGMDSVVMLALLRDLSTELGFVVGVAHADHGLRGEASQQDAEFVRHLAVEWNLPVFVETLPVREYARRHHCGIEMAARLLRYEFLQRSARAFGATHVAVAHTADDNAETVLLNLLRGAGLEGLSGIPPQRELFSDCFLIRPLLSLRKRHLHEYACSRGLLWREDVSNRELYFRRNRIRWELLPTIERIMPGALDNINRSSALLRQALSGIHQLLEPLLQQTALPDGNGFLIADSQWTHCRNSSAWNFFGWAFGVWELPTPHRHTVYSRLLPSVQLAQERKSCLAARRFSSVSALGSALYSPRLQCPLCSCSPMGAIVPAPGSWSFVLFCPTKPISRLTLGRNSWMPTAYPRLSVGGHRCRETIFTHWECHMKQSWASSSAASAFLTGVASL
ncbi:MAG: tRNA lysidine(34) synthetase TilS [Bacteroidota bacterium]|nr:tRNA lysidine(34) synthetase TilS [Bacteroidota bacterium]